MHSMIRAGELPPTPGGTVTFEGEPYGSGVSRRGHARMTADDKDFEAGPGDIVVVGSETPHKFTNAGTEPLDIICVHASPRMIQEWLEQRADSGPR